MSENSAGRNGSSDEKGCGLNKCFWTSLGWGGKQPPEERRMFCRHILNFHGNQQKHLLWLKTYGPFTLSQFDYAKLQVLFYIASTVESQSGLLQR